jgi:type II secretion system protein G
LQVPPPRRKKLPQRLFFWALIGTALVLGYSAACLLDRGQIVELETPPADSVSSPPAAEPVTPVRTAQPEITQKLCPVTGRPINPAVFVNYVEPAQVAAVVDMTMGYVMPAPTYVPIKVVVANRSDTALEAVKVAMAVDGKVVERRATDPIPAGLDQTLRFHPHIEDPGLHIIAAGIAGPDGVPSGRGAVRVVEVRDKTPVLLVNGAPSDRQVDDAADFIRLALWPGGDVAENRFVPKTVTVEEFQKLRDFAPYDVIVLANVPRLSPPASQALERFVAEGGGLLIVPGHKVEPRFYEEWRTGDGKPLAPARLSDRRTPTPEQSLFGFKSAIDLLSGIEPYDFEKVSVRAYWTLEVDRDDRHVRVDGFMGPRAPLLVERELGKGYVAMTALSLDMIDSDLPARGGGFILKLVIPLVCHLAEGRLYKANLQPGEEFSVELPLKLPPGDGRKGDSAADLLRGKVEVITPSKNRVQATIRNTPRGAKVSFKDTSEAGLYSVEFPAKTSEQFVLPAKGANRLPFAVCGEVAAVGGPPPKARRIYFCRRDCIATFNEDPERYLKIVDDQHAAPADKIGFKPEPPIGGDEKALPAPKSPNKDEITRMQMGWLVNALEIYRFNIGHYPTDEEGGLDALVTKPAFDDEILSQNWRGPYIHDLLDPWGNLWNYELSVPGTRAAEQTPFKLWSSGPNGQDDGGAGDDIKNWLGR